MRLPIAEVERAFLLPVLWLSLAALAGCGADQTRSEPDRPGAEARLGPDARLDEERSAWVERTLSEMSVREMAAQVIVAWMPGSYVSTDSEAFDDAVARVERGFGGLWLMGGLPHARTVKLNALQRRAKVPLLVFSGAGLGRRLLAARRDTWMLGGGTDLPPALAYGAIGDPAAVREAARIVGAEARATGVHISDGPEGNVLTNLRNVLINRTFGDDPEQVGRLSAAYVQGAHDAGLLTSAGFFPGAGDLDEDPHVRLPVLRSDRERLDAVELVPFRHAIRAGTDLVMTSHFAVPALTGSDALPATLSPEVVGVLREELGFEGLVITDAFDMGALTADYEHLDAAIRAFRAGHDLLLGPEPFALADTLAALARNGGIPLERLRASVRRILEAKARLGLHERRVVPLERVGEVVGSRPHQRAADSAAARSLVLLRDEDHLVPFVRRSGVGVLSVTLAREETEAAGNTFDGVLREHVESLGVAGVSLRSGGSTYDMLLRRAREADLVVLSVYLEPRLGVDPYHADLPDGIVDFVGRLRAEGKPTVVVSFGKLTVLDRLPDLGTFLLAWSGQDVMQRAAARAFLGMTALTGRLPVALPPHHRTGDGLSR